MQYHLISTAAASVLLLAAAPAPAQFVDFNYRGGGLGILRPRVDVRVQGGFPGYGGWPYYGGFPYYPYPATFAAPAPYAYPWAWGGFPAPYGYGGGCFVGPDGRVYCR